MNTIRQGSMRCAIGLLLACAAAFAQSYDFARFARDLYDLEALTRVDFADTRMESSWDRAGGNNDALYGARRHGDVYTIADLRGPGVVRRFYAARPGGRLRIVVDGRVLIEMPCEEFFAGRHEPFLRPLVGPMGGSNYSFFPIPYARSLRIETEALRPADFPYGVYYQVTYQTFPDGTPVRSLELPLPAADRESLRRAAEAWRNSGVDPKPVSGEQITVVREVRLEPGQRVEVARLAGPASIDRFHVKLETADATVLRSTLLKMRWDEETKDGVDCPLGDFFGNGFNQAPYRSLPMGLTDAGYYSFWAMPFARRAIISVLNQSVDATVAGRVIIVYHRTAGMPENAGYFHAKWRREEVVATDLYYENNSGEYNYHAADIQGQGRFVGLNLNVYNRHTAWWGEGDPMVFVDNQPWPPAIHGTGTEEYFNDGWGFHQYMHAAGADPGGKERNVIPVSGVLVGGVDAPNECFAGNAVFSFHLADSIPFRSRLLVTFEHGQEQNDLSNDYASTAYWYARPRARDFFAMRPARERANIPESEWPALRKRAVAEHLEWIRETLAEFAAAIPYEPNDDRLSRPRAVFLMWALEASEPLGLSKAEHERLRNAWQSFRGTEAERRRNVDRVLVELADKLGVRR